MTLRLSERTLRVAIAALALALGVIAAVTPLGLAIDRSLDPLRFRALSRDASGQIVIVENDAASVAAIQRWPWPRDNHARVVDQLRRAGAASITFDVDFSSSSTPDGDAALVGALKRADGLVTLTTFAQQATSGARRQIDALPLPMFRDHVALASPSVIPDADGLVRAMPFGTVTDDTPRPSLGAYMARRSGAADTFFPIDYAIDPASIPRLSFVSVRDGRFDPRAVRGRDVIIGATAIEMGDRYATPRWGVIPGVVVQALSAETLLRGVPKQLDAAIGIVIALLLSMAFLRPAGRGRAAAASVAAMAVFIAAALLAQGRLLWILPLGPGLVVLGTAIAGRIGLDVWRRFEDQRLEDEASGLPNRRAMLADLKARPAARLAVAHVTNFESLAAVLGAEADRDLIQRIADRLRLSSDGGGVYRIADRLLAFAVSRDEDEEALMAGLRAVLLQPVEVKGRRVDAMVTIGLADAADPDTALTEAAMAADAAAREGAFWRRDAADLARLEREVSLMGELDQALRTSGIEVHYQPKLALAEDRIASVEALVRWRHPDRGFIGPDLFIPLAEQTDRIAPLTLHLIEQVMRDVARWRALGHDVTAAVNISAKLVASPTFDEAVRALLDRRIVPPSALVFEVTESATLADPDAAAAALTRFRDLGVAISMDDYGTGQSTLTYLRRLPLSELKIDRSFVQHLHRNHNDAVLVRSTIDLAHELGLKVVAEGVEEAECLAALRALGCDLVQGYFVSRPLPADALLAFLTGAEAKAA